MVGASLLYVAAGVCAVWFVHNVLGVEGDAILVALLVVPLVLYLVLSGRVREFAAGSVSVKLSEVGRAPVKDTYVKADLVPTIDPSMPLILKTDPNRPQVAALTQGARPYPRDEVLSSLKNMAELKPTPMLIVRDKRGHVLAHMTYRSAIDLLSREGRGDEFIKLVNGDDPDAFDDGGGFSAVKTETLPSNATNAEALAAMEETGLDTLVVVDPKGRFEGIVERDRLLSQMLLAVVSP
jgi:CBS domain-containing protein